MLRYRNCLDVNEKHCADGKCKRGWGNDVRDSVEIFKLHEYKHCAVCKCKRRYRKCKW